ncbi:MAG: hypothetical protein DI598_04870 [Pseudopedobacter saltans]|uniref:Uncharacterized protein n=1 Tax=Pseudopedobacter saltans TaxID=151895 RepID=A0A2W5H578_9SPHI|nr:MAG: hypothetical protein DI598_04870 [Pseudopedobacter saltans]
MRKFMISLTCCLSIGPCLAQNNVKLSQNEVRRSFAQAACKCMDSIEFSTKSKEDVHAAVVDCIKKQVQPYQLVSTLSNIDTTKNYTINANGKKTINVSFDMDENSQQNKTYYYDLEKYLLDSCDIMRKLLSSNNALRSHSISKDPKALEQYNAGQVEMEKSNNEIAIIYFKDAVAIDSNFTFAWDNLGICYRKSGKFADAVNAYEHSLRIDSSSLTPLQNIAVAYQYLKKFDEAANAYERIQRLDSTNPEGYYGLGRMYTIEPIDYPKALNNMCKAYNLYIEQKSAFQNDAVQIIRLVYQKMKEEGKENEFKEILSKNHIKTQE